MKYLLLVLVVGLAFYVLGESQLIFGKSNSAVERISVDEVYQMIKSDKKFVLVDVRTPGEFMESHIPNARLLPLDTIKEGVLSDIAKDELIVVYCRSGARSAKAASKLVELGFSNVRDMGGIMKWPYETVSGK